jgi:nucleoside-diphosphate-sugar epimerase
LNDNEKGPILRLPLRILLSGRTSFIGRILAKRFQDAGDEIFFLTRANNYQSNEFGWDFKGCLPKEIPPCDVIIHLAAHVYFGTNFYKEQYDLNTVSTLRLAAAAKNWDAHFIFASMAGIHGSASPEIDKNTPVQPENHYAMSKYLGEESAKALAPCHTIMRIGGVYGLDGPAHLGLNAAITDAVRKGKPPILRGPGKARRNYICVTDIARWIGYIVERDGTEIKSASGNVQETLYAAGTEILTIEEYLQAIINVVLPNREIERRGGREAQDQIVRPSPSPFRQMRFKEYLAQLISTAP